MSANEFYTNHMTTFLCHVTTSFGHHVISFLQPTVQNSNGGFTTLVILIVRENPPLDVQNLKRDVWLWSRDP